MPQSLNASQTDLYSDAAETTAAPPPEEQTPAADTEKSEDGNNPIVPLSALGEGVKPGDRCEFEIVRIFDSQAELRYIKEAGEGGEGGEGDQYGEGGGEGNAAAPPAGELASMME